MRMSDERFKKVFNPGEYTAWQCWPSKGLIFNNWDAALVPVTLIVGYLLAKFASTLFTQGSFAASILGVLSLFVAMSITFGRFFVKYWQRKNTKYIVTNQRIHIVEDYAGFKVASIDLSAIKTLRQVQSKAHIASLVLTDAPNWKVCVRVSGLGWLLPFMAVPANRILQDLPEPEKTGQIIDELRASIAA